ncbi:CYFA0S02e01992g1_1 [Cyberlindnera fabianii]|uniref:Alpha-1,4 glucan phosphorylase n=1 Tax=Cyberlindnera fabianii TaxID=36022 RepID=A0A061AMY1_CYBFA|nr:CYFA0S02e01992g1_1 [Cyberlindnera fabianii]
MSSHYDFHPGEPPAGSADQLPRPKHIRRFTGFSPAEIKTIDSIIPLKSRETWKKFAVENFTTKEGFESTFVRHVETTLARSLYNCDELAAYQATSSTLRDNLITNWNKTQQKQTTKDQKRVYYLSLEFLMGRALDNALINTDNRDLVKGAVDDLGFNLEDVLEQEPDAALGNGGLGRLAACFIDSMSSGNYPGWGYGLRYQYGIFSQKIVDGYQVETPDYWLKFFNPWEIPRLEIQIPVDFYGYVEHSTNSEGKSVANWVGGERFLAVAYDFPVPGYKTDNVNNLRLWSAQPATEFDFAKFNAGDYKNSVADQQRAESITAVLYPNDNFDSGKELRLKQQYFWVCASLHDIVRRFKKSKRPWSEFPDQVAIQLNDTHPTLAIPELQRVLVDLEGLDWDEAWSIVTQTFGYTNHTVMQEALEKWPVPLIQRLLPRHLEIIYEINLFFLQSVEKRFPKDRDLLSRVSIVEESSTKQIRMAYLAIIGSHKVNGVAELHSELLKATIFKDFVNIYGASKFTNVTNGVTPRRWLKQANPELADIITEKLGSDAFLKDFSLLKELEKYSEDADFQKAWAKVKYDNKVKLIGLIKKLTGIEIGKADVLFDIQVKRIHEYKRQQMNIFGVISRYLKIKKSSPAEREKILPKVSIFGGKSAPGYYMAKTIIKLINSVSDVVNNDPDVGDLLKVVFIPDYNVSKAEVIIPASDLSEHISTAGTEASGTSNMKFVMNGGLIIGTVDGANVEITRECGEDNIFLFGHLAENVEDIRHSHRYGGYKLPDSLEEVFSAIENGTFGDAGEFRPLVESIRYHSDHYLVGDDFDSYLQAHELVDEAYLDQKSWIKKSITSVANMGFFSSDRCIQEYADSIWNIEPLET